MCAAANYNLYSCTLLTWPVLPRRSTMRRVLASDFASKRVKRRKIDSSEKKDARFSASGEMEAQQRQCYLDRLPDNVLENIMRLMSASPRASAWAEQLADSDLCTLFSLGGEMERVARECFRSLSIDNAQSICSGPVCKWWKPDTYRVAISSTKISNAKLMNLASPSYTALEIQNHVSNLFERPVDLDEFLRKCPNVKDLEICSDSTRIWIQKLGPRLERLEILSPTRSVSLAISSYCTQLRELHIGETDKSDVGRTDLWKKVGGTLEKLGVTFTFSAFKEIRKIQQHCRKIRWLHIPVEERVNLALAECIVSYGEQLEYAFLANMNQSQLEAIVTACPNAVFHVYMNGRSHGYSLQLVGSCLQRAVLFRCTVNDFCRLTKGWNACPNIEKAALFKEVSLSYVRAMFTKPKPVLLELEIFIGFGEEMSTVRKIVDCIAEGTGALRHLNLTIGGLADGLFDKLVARNQSLQEFICRADVYEDDGKCDVVKMVEGILKLPKLNGCWISANNIVGTLDGTRKKMKEVVRPHRHRQLVVAMIGHTYLR